MPYDSNRKIFSAERNLMKQHGIQPVHHAVSNTSNKEVLKALKEIKVLLQETNAQAATAAAAVVVEPGPVAAQSGAEELPEMSVLRIQLMEMKESIDKTKSEIAALHKPGEDDGDDRFVTAAMELDAIVKATEVATNNILGAAEDIDDLAREIKDRSNDVKTIDNVDSIANAVINIFENCNFQDITGQRTSKVVKTINFLEERILTMIGIWGEEEFEGIELPEDLRSDDEKLLSGPQLEGQGISQNDIDSLFD